MRNSLIFFVALLFVLLTSVACSSGNWKYIIDTPSMNIALGIYFEGNYGFFYGHNIADDDFSVGDGPSMWERFEAAIYKVDLRKNSEWIKVFSGRGQIEQIKKIDGQGSFLALGREFHKDDEERAYFLLSNDFGETWVELSKPAPLFIGFDLDENLNGYAWSQEKIYRTQDGAKSWIVVHDSIIVQRNIAEPKVDLDGVLWYYSIAEGLVLHKTPAGESRAERPANDYRVDGLFVANDNAVWLVGRAGKDWKEKVLLLKKSKDRKNGFLLAAELPYFLPRGFYVGPNVISIFGSDMSVRPPKRMLMRSFDQGKTWNRETPKDAYAHGPVYFENENIIWNVATKDRIQRRSQ